MPSVSDRPWSGISSASYANAAEYCAACLIDENEPGDTHSKARCKLPVYEPQRLGGRLIAMPFMQRRTGSFVSAVAWKHRLR